MRDRYYQCGYCGQVVQGFNATQMIQCCDRQRGHNWAEIEGPVAQYKRELDEAHEEALAQHRRGMWPD